MKISLVLVHNFNGFARIRMKMFTNYDVLLKFQLFYVYCRKNTRRRLRDLSIVQNSPNLEEINSEQQTTIGSSNVPETPNEPAEIQTESGGSRRTQGHTLLKDLYELNPVERVKVSRKNLGQLVGSEARLLAGYLGIIARNANMLPINYESWHQMPDSNKNQALDNIKPGMLRYQWEDAVRFWNLNKGEELSSGQKVGRLQLFDITYRKKDRSPMTSEAGEIMDKLKDEKEEYESIASRDSSINLEDIDNRIITEVLGPERYGQVRLQGSGVNPTQYFGSSLQQYMPTGSQAQAEVQRLRDQMAQMQASIVEQIVQLKAEAVAREADQNKKYNELELQLQNMMKMFQQSQNPPS
ncbi:hypothetical protein GOBAR_AA02662 [Gossypium barbadense]|uniref:Uncharacterized protein n=1 Tax=Gossypium barbadense TaxID=3634 RepID=A0A2P5YQS9_GOSBA|nr:hypothetical protein GOBAR_AA02662 [Gossypium barbadense]